MTAIYIVLVVVCLVLALGCFGFAVMAGADPEGRGRNFVIAGLAGAAVFAVAFVVLIVIVIGRLFSG